MKSWDELLEASLKSEQVDKVPNGFKTAKEWAKIYKRDVRQVERLFTRLGFEKEKFRVILGGQCREVTHWRQGWGNKNESRNRSAILINVSITAAKIISELE